MAEITAALVKSFRDKTGLPMMDCKKALTEADGDAEKALTILREKGKLKMIEKGAERTTEEGVLATAANDNGVAIIELLCESAPVAGNPEFLQLAQDIATVYLEKGGQTAEEVMANASPSKAGMTLQEQLEELQEQIRRLSGKSPAKPKKDAAPEKKPAQQAQQPAPESKPAANPPQTQQPDAENGTQIGKCSICGLERVPVRKMILHDGTPGSVCMTCYQEFFPSDSDSDGDEEE